MNCWGAPVAQAQQPSMFNNVGSAIVSIGNSVTNWNRFFSYPLFVFLSFNFTQNQ